MKKWMAWSLLSLAFAWNLTGNNYTMIHAGATGEDSGFYFLGFIPIVSPSYGDAKKDLYRSVGEPLEGRAIALANYTEDRSTLYLILFSVPTLSVTADVVEFTDTPSVSAPGSGR